MKMALGISAFMLLLISMPIPFVGTYVTFLALVIATFAALAGETVLTITTVILSAIKVYLLSPTWHIALFGATYTQAINNSSFAQQYGDAGTNQLTQSASHALAGANATNQLMTIAFLAAPVVALIVRNASKKKPTKSKASPQPLSF